MIRLGNKQLDFPLIQGGMGVGVSLGNLAGHVMKEGCMGVISCAHPGYRKADFYRNTVATNIEALHEEVIRAKEISGGKGLLGVNIMVASKHYGEYVKASIKAGVDAIISGAGLPLDLPSYRSEKDQVLLAPIVSSAKAAVLICKVWDKRYQCLPDFMVIEGQKAGGHLGFKLEDLVHESCESLEEIVKKTRRELMVFEEKYQRKIPLFVAGGMFDGYDLKKAISWGAQGIQMGTRFIATHECDANLAFKQMIIDAKASDIGLIQSPTGFPGRAIRNKFIKESEARGNIRVTSCVNCLIPCNPADTPYCITQALIKAVSGDVEEGLVFAGSNADRVKGLVTVKELVHEIKQQFMEVKS